MKQVLTIEEIARETGLEESLLRFYESEFPGELPGKVLQGDVLSFDSNAVEAFRKIHQRHATGDSNGPDRTSNRYARVIAVTSGKGGVGKTNIALNLAIEMQRLGKMCVVLDADMGMANIHLLAGITPSHDILELFTSGLNIAEIIVEGPEGIGIIPGGGGVLALADSTRQQRMQIVAALAEVERAADMIVVDTGAGMGPGVRDFLLSADDLLFVLTPDITSLADAYGLLKALHRKNMSDRPIYSVVNMVNTMKQAVDVARRFSTCAVDFLGREVRNIGYLMKDSSVGAATARRTPYCVFKPQANVSRNTRNLAKALLQSELPEIRMSSAFGRYMKMLRGDRPTTAAA